ncbi:MAG: TonB-dependent receptor [Chitinophagaceae bacterium]|nr:TonB-dependent receptor [Chitinophagaceae bacterium]
MRKPILLCIMLIVYIYAHAQNTLTGKVTDSKTNAPIEGASIKVKHSKTGTSTDNNGHYAIPVKPGDLVEISSIGYITKTISIVDGGSLDIALEPSSTELREIVFVGTRGAGRAKTETPVPVDVIKINQIDLPTAKMDLTSVLNIAAPSFNYNKQSGADGADHIDIGTLRGLGPDQTLVLINGKRRHQTAFVTLFGTRGRGNSGVDLNAFPEASVDRIEILRDGASAQYGSDAIAGVINIILKKDPGHLTMNTGWSGYYDHKFNSRKFNAGNQYVSGGAIDGNTFTFSLDGGIALGKKGGFMNIGADFLTQGKTYRQADTANWQKDKNALPSINSGRRAFGDGSLTSGGVMYNMELPTGTGRTTFYSFGGVNYKSSDAYAYSRNWSQKPERFPVDNKANLLFTPGIMRQTNDGETYFNPHIQTHIQDASLAVGIKGMTGNDWTWDLSNTLGRNDFHFFGDKTFNASIIGKNAPNHFDDGGFNFLQNTVNLDFGKSFKSVASGLNLGLGAEFRYERYSIYAGEYASYSAIDTNQRVYSNLTSDSLRAPAAGSQGFPGFSLADVKTAHRTNLGIYADGELNVTNAWLVDIAGRFEHYSDFGSVVTGKLATRYKLLDNLNIRGSVSTGYRAPSLQQINFSNTLTSFSSGQLVQSRIASNNEPITRAAGIPKLKQETSVNASAGFSWKAAPGLTFTVDGYWVKMKNRIVLSGLFSQNDSTLPGSFTSQFPKDVATVQFFSNAVNTTNYGLDIVADYTTRWEKNSFHVLLAGNLQHMTIDAIHVPPALSDSLLSRNTFYSDREKAFLLASAPNHKFALSLDYTMDKIGFGTHFTYFGKIKLMGFGAKTADNPNQTGINPMVNTDADGNKLVPEVFNFGGKVVTDIYASYKFCKHATVFIGADNLFNIHPDLGVNPLAKGWAGDNESGGPWDSVQMGFNGLRLFGKLSLNL